MCEIHYQWSPGTELGARKDLLTKHTAHTHTHAHTQVRNPPSRCKKTRAWDLGLSCSSQMPSDDESVPRGVCLEILKQLFANLVWLGTSSGLPEEMAER